MGVSVVVGYRPDHGHRDRAWRWIRRRWQHFFPDYEIVAASDGQDTNDPVLFSTAIAKNRAAAQASGDVLIVADADTAFDPQWVAAAVQLVTDGTARWALAEWYEKLDEMATSNMLAKPVHSPVTGRFEYRGGSSWSGCLIVPRAGFEAAGGFDERFVGWGPDDVAFAMTLLTLWGPVWRTAGSTVWHFWHPYNIVDYAGHANYPAQRTLARDYHEAVCDPVKLRLVTEGKPAWT